MISRIKQMEFHCFLKQESKIIEKDNLVMLEEIHSILKNCSNLTDREKLDYCKNQRYLMKVYLREFNKKILRRNQELDENDIML